jgi:ubiquinone/menaquinone biosynthesis C-methylase UbiE
MRASRRQLLKTAVLAPAMTCVGQAASQQTNAGGEGTRQRMVAMTNGFRISEMIHVAAKLRIADELARGPKTVTQLATATKTNADSLYRLLRALAGLGIFAEEDDFHFRLTPAAELLRSEVPGSVHALAETSGEDWMWLSWGALLHSVTTGETAFVHLYGENTFDWFKKHPEAARIYDAFQSQNSARSSEEVVAAYDFSTARTIVDVGGGEGILIASILRHNGSARGVLFDPDYVIESAQAKFDPTIGSRCELVAGDFFSSIPGGGDLYVMKYILHDWDDRRDNAILVNCRRAMAGQGKLLVVEDIVCGRNQPCYGKEADIMMMVRTGGRNRTEKEYRDLLKEGGFEVTRVFPSRGGPSVIEALPRS